MKLKAQITIDINQYENVKPEIEIDTEDLGAAKELILKLWDAFHGLCQNRYNPKGEIDELNSQLQMDAETRKEYGKTDFKMQDLFDKVRQGKAIPVEVWQGLNESDQNILHKAILQFNQEQRLNKKDAKVQVQS
jgi:hypothetical protein